MTAPRPQRDLTPIRRTASRLVREAQVQDPAVADGIVKRKDFPDASTIFYKVMWLFATGKLADRAKCKADCEDVDMVRLKKDFALPSST